MTIEEAIKHSEEVAEEKDKSVELYKAVKATEGLITKCEKCAKEHRQLAEWLKELKALKEKEPCEDCVSRQAVLEYVEGSEAELGHSSENELVCQDIKDFPSVTPQPKTGHWIDDNCSICGYGVKPWNNTLYCPNCGAKMIEPQESEGKE